MTLQSNIIHTITEAAARVCPCPPARPAAAALALCLLLIATSCSTESIDSTRTDNTGAADDTPVPVVFDTYTTTRATTNANTTTRANTSAMTQEALQRNGFGVFAYHTQTDQWAGKDDTHTPNFMYNQPVTFERGYWKYEPIKYWPNDYSTGDVDNKQGVNGEEHAATGSQEHSYLTFFAYAPYTKVNVSDGYAVAPTTGITAITSNTATGAPTVTYALPTDITTDNLVDLLWATPQEDKEKQPVNEKVRFSFHHGLAGVEIDVVRDLEDNISDKAKDTKIFVCELTMQAENAYTTGTMSLYDGTWTGQSGYPATLTYTLKSDDIDAGLRGAAYDNVAPNKTYADTDAGKTQKATDETAIEAIRNAELRTWDTKTGVDGTQRPLSDTKLLFIPAPGNEAVTLTPTVKYSFVTHDDNLVLNTTLSTQLNGNTWRFARIYHDSQSNGSAAFTVKAGKLYKLLIHIGVTHVTFEVTGVEDWASPVEEGGISKTESSGTES